MGISLLFSILFRKFLIHRELRNNKIIVLIIIFIIINILSSLFSENPAKSLFQVINIISVFSIYFSVFNIIETKEEYLKFLNTILTAGFCAMFYGLLLFFLRKIGFNVTGVNDINNPAFFGIYASLFEPNIFGSYSANMLLIGIGVFMLFSYEDRNKKMLLIFLIISLLALLLSFTRAAWLGAFCGLLFILFKRVKCKIFKIRYIGSFILFFILIYYLFLFKILPEELYGYKLANLFNFNVGTGLYRLNIFINAWHDFLLSPIIGNGTYSYSYLHAEETIIFNGNIVNAWIPNLFLIVLNDTGIIGFTILIIIIWEIFKQLKELIYNSTNHIFYYHAIGYKAAFIALLVAFQATTAFYLGFTWILIAMISLSFCFSKEVNAPKIINYYSE